MNKEFSYQNKKIYYRVIGSGKPVMLIHGFGEESNVWENQIEFLKDKFQLIIPELPGSGRSEMIGDMSIEGMAEVIKHILDSAYPKLSPSGGFRGAIIGHSMGGYITLALAEKYPGYLSAFGLFHSTAYADNEEKKAVRRKGIELIRKHGAFEFLKTTTANLFSPNSQKKMPDLIEKFISRLNDFSSGPLIACYEAMMQRPDRTAILKKTTIPVLFV